MLFLAHAIPPLAPERVKYGEFGNIMLAGAVCVRSTVEPDWTRSGLKMLPRMAERRSE
jgi:hypothetical protein